MTMVRLFLDDIRIWKRLHLPGGQWALLFGIAVGVVPAVSGISAMAGMMLVLGIRNGALDLDPMPFMLLVSALFAMLYGAIPAIIGFAALRLLAGALGYVNLQLVLIVAGLGTLVAELLVLGGPNEVGLSLLAAVLFTSALFWVLLRSAGLGVPD